MKKKSIQRVIKSKLKFNNNNNSGSTNDNTGTNNISTTQSEKAHTITLKDKLINRSSSQRISLFKYPHVEVETNSSESVITSKFSNNQSKSKLLARGPIEIYEIRTVSSRSFFFSVGRHGEWIHPMLPKLRIRRIIDLDEFYLFILFSNPDRIWKIKFIECDEIKIDNEMIKDLETVITGICQYSCVKSLDLISNEIEIMNNINNQQVRGQLRQNNSKITEKEEEEEDLEELNYLLEIESDNNLSDGNVYEKEEEKEEEMWDDDGTTDVEMDTSINDAFRKAMNNLIPPWDHKLKASDKKVTSSTTITTLPNNNDSLHITKRRNNSTSKRRISLYIPSSSTDNNTNDKIFDNHSNMHFLNHKNLNRRSISIFSDYETLTSLYDLKL